MPDPAPVASAARRVRRMLPVVLAVLVSTTTLSLTTAQPAQAGPPDHREQLRFMWAMAGQESGWDYYARNASSGAFGKYQIMPFNWPAWAEQYLGDARADQTPYNQERVAYGKLHDLYRWLGSWKRVAYWWLTGSSEKNEKRWSSYAKRYVTNIMRLRKRAPEDGWAMPPQTSSRASKGDWRRAIGTQRLRLKLGGRAWPSRGRIEDGQLLKIRQAKSARKGERWIRVVTVDGRLGWLKQLRTVPARKPATARRWSDVDDRGTVRWRADRAHVRPHPR